LRQFQLKNYKAGGKEQRAKLQVQFGIGNESSGTNLRPAYAWESEIVNSPLVSKIQ
jgi:hypothetical protein